MTVTGPARVHDNRWDELDVPDVGSLDTWQPTLSVSVVVPAYNVGAPLGRCLAMLARQTYPRSLIEVVVADDGSQPPVDITADLDGLNVKVVRQEHEGFGAGRARNLGAEHASGDVLLFCDADMVLEPVTLEAHLRWHHAAWDVVSLGKRMHAEFDDVSLSDLLSLDGQQDWHDVVASREQWGVEWIDAYMAKHDRMLRPDDEAFRLTTAANVMVRRILFEEIGGFRAFGIRGIEDTEFGYRLWNAGALMVWDPDAMGWHDGRSTFQGNRAEQVRRERAPAMADYLPTPRFRKPAPGRSYAVPWLVARVEVFDQPAAQVAACVEALLGSDRHDLLVQVVRDPSGAQAARIDRALASDPRVRLAAPGEDHPEDRRSLLQAWVPPEAAVSPVTLSLLAGHVGAHAGGMVRATVPGLAPAVGVVRVVRTRALARAERLAGTGRRVEDEIATWFGQEWVVGADLGVRRVEPDGRLVGEDGTAPDLTHLPLPEAVAEWQRRLASADARIAALESRLERLAPRDSRPSAPSPWRGRLVTGVRRLTAVRSIDDARRLVATVRRVLS